MIDDTDDQGLKIPEIVRILSERISKLEEKLASREESEKVVNYIGEIESLFRQLAVKAEEMRKAANDVRVAFKGLIEV